MTQSKIPLYKFLLTLLSTFSAFLISIVANNKNYELPWLLVSLLSIILISIIVYSCEKWLNNYLIYLSKEEVLKHYTFEKDLRGTWLEYFWKDDLLFLGIIKFHYDVDSNQLDAEGHVYDTDGIRIASWQAELVYSYQNKRSIFYRYGGQLENETLADEGHCRIFFNQAEDDKFYQGNGYFRDLTTEHKPINFQLERIEDSYIKRIISKPFIQTEEDRVKLIESFNQGNKKFIKYKPKQ